MSPLIVLSVVTAIALLLSVAGVFREFLPGAGTLAGLLAALHLLRLAMRRPWAVGDWRHVLRTHAFSIGLFAVCVLSVMVRFPNFASDLSHTPLDIDEQRIASNLRHFFATGEPRHAHIEQYPGVVFWLFAASSLLSFLRGLSSGVVTAHAPLLPVEAFAHASRLANIWVAAATVAITGLLGLRLSGISGTSGTSGTLVGLLAALLVAIAPISVETTVLVRNDPGMVLAVTAATYAALAYYDSGKLAWIAAAGAIAGLAAAIKYSAVFALAPVTIAACSAVDARGRLRAGAVAVLTFGLAVAASNHFIWTDFPNFLRQLADQYAFTGLGHRWSTDDPVSVYVTTLAWAGPGWAVMLLFAGFTVYALSTGNPRLWILISFPLVYFWFMTQRPLQVPRWVYPLVPFIALGGAAALAAGLHAIHARVAVLPAFGPRAFRAAAALVVVGVLLQPLWAGAVSASRRINRPTHVLAEAWIQEHATPGTVALLGQGWLDLRGTQVLAQRVPNLSTALDGGLAQLGGCDWVIVPETVFEHPTLRQLGVLQSFYADRSFGGNLGIDYKVYSVPDLFETGICSNPTAKR